MKISLFAISVYAHNKQCSAVAAPLFVTLSHLWGSRGQICKFLDPFHKFGMGPWQKYRRNRARLEICGNIKTATYGTVRSVNAPLVLHNVAMHQPYVYRQPSLISTIDHVTWLLFRPITGWAKLNGALGATCINSKHIWCRHPARNTIAYLQLKNVVFNEPDMWHPTAHI